MYCRIGTGCKVIAFVLVCAVVIDIITALFSFMYYGRALYLEETYSKWRIVLLFSFGVFCFGKLIERSRKIQRWIQIALSDVTEEEKKKLKLLDELEQIMNAIEDEKISPARLQELNRLVASIQGELKK